MSTFTIINWSDYSIQSGLTLDDAAHEVLSCDESQFEIREAKEGGYSLWSSNPSLNQDWVETKFFSREEDAEKAKEEIFTMVVDNPRFQAICEVLTDEMYDEIKSNSDQNSIFLGSQNEK